MSVTLLFVFPLLFVSLVPWRSALASVCSFFFSQRPCPSPLPFPCYLPLPFWWRVHVSAHLCLRIGGPPRGRPPIFHVRTPPPPPSPTGTNSSTPHGSTCPHILPPYRPTTRPLGGPAFPHVVAPRLLPHPFSDTLSEDPSQTAFLPTPLTHARTWTCRRASLQRSPSPGNTFLPPPLNPFFLTSVEATFEF